MPQAHRTAHASVKIARPSPTRFIHPTSGLARAAATPIRSEHSRKCQTITATPAEPGELPNSLGSLQLIRKRHAATWIPIKPLNAARQSREATWLFLLDGYRTGWLCGTLVFKPHRPGARLRRPIAPAPLPTRTPAHPRREALRSSGRAVRRPRASRCPANREGSRSQNAQGTPSS